MASSFAIRPIAGALGAEIRGVDLSQELGADTVGEIRQALLDHLVVFFRDQRLTPAQQLAFARCFGEPCEYPFVRGLDECPEIVPVIKERRERVNFGGVWHSDTAYLEKPPMGTLLYAREVPPVGGDTLFANTYLAYESLSPGLQRVLEGLVGVNVASKSAAAATRENRVRDRPKDPSAIGVSAEHPVVRTHPETGRKALYVNLAHTVSFRDMSEEESAPLLDYLFAVLTRPEHTCRFRWEGGSLAFWDNRCTLHNPINDYHGYRREMHRVTLAGNRP